MSLHLLIYNIARRRRVNRLRILARRDTQRATLSLLIGSSSVYFVKIASIRAEPDEIGLS